MTGRDGAPDGRSPWAFLGLTLALSVPFLVLGAVVSPPRGAAVDLPVSALQVLAPSIAALLLLVHTGGFRAVGRFFADAVTVRGLRGPGWLVVALLIMPLGYLLSAVVMVVVGRPLPEPRLTVTSLLALFVLFAVSGFLEELGWTGYVLDPLRRQLGCLGAVLVIGVVCALFHVGADLQHGRDFDWILWHRAGTIVLRMIIVLVHHRTGRVLWAAVLVHTTDNVSWATFPVGGSHHDPSLTTPIGLGLGLLLVLGAGLGRHPARAVRHTETDQEETDPGGARARWFRTSVVRRRDRNAAPPSGVDRA